MADFLTAVKTVGKKSNDEVEPSLTAVSTRQVQEKVRKVEPHDLRTSRDDEPTGNDGKNGHSRKDAFTSTATTPEEALQVLRSQPDTDSLIRILKQLRSEDAFKPAFSLHPPGPLQAQIINAIISNIIPAFWASLGRKDRGLIVTCLTNLAGIGAVAAKVRLLSDSNHKSPGQAQELADLVSVLHDVLSSDDSVLHILSGLAMFVTEKVKLQMAKKELVKLISSGKIIAATAQAEDSLKSTDTNLDPTWMSRGTEYAAWIGRNVASLSMSLPSDSEVAAQILARGLGLGYSVYVAKSFIGALLRGQGSYSTEIDSALKATIGSLPAFARNQLIESTLLWLSSMTESDVATKQVSQEQEHVAPIAALIDMLCKSNESVRKQMVEILATPSRTSVMSFVVRRACVAVVADNDLQPLLERLMGTFGDHLFVAHSPIIQQESIAQTLLLVAGALHHNDPMAVKMTTRSSSHMQGISNRLDSTNAKARWLGMVVGTAISSLVDKEGSRMNFGTNELKTNEGGWYLELVKINDSVGQIPDFVKFLQSSVGAARRQKRTAHKTEQMPILNGKPVFGPVRPPAPVQTEVIGDKVTELFDDGSDDEDADLKPYAKPDSDPEDSDEDATLVTRNKPRAPVYVRDLMRMLQDDKSPARFQMGVNHAPLLIRRKTNFGREVKDHAEEIASILCNLQDPFETENFDELKLRALIAAILSDAHIMAPWMCRQAFVGDFSLSQRCIMLSALGLAGRELAGFKNEDSLNPDPSSGNPTFPTKRLPSHLHTTYNPSDKSIKHLHDISQKVEHKLIQPLALSAADKSTSHLDAIKVRTFSSRMAVEQQRTKRKLPPNELAKMFGSQFFHPLVSRYHQEIAAYGSASLFSSAPFVVVTFLKTLALLFHASGSATADLPEVTNVFWELLLSLRTKASGDISILQAVLFSFLTVLEIAGEGLGRETLARDYTKLVVETQNWVEVIFEKTGSGQLVSEGSGDEVRVRTLAAGILVRLKEVGDAWNKVLTGGMMG
ncbi:telomere length regulation protein [Zymoseptoria brevis]|uniref:Telomere length regulation protein n=1 Tax=Zymoseptoria brevis TaxID=1047168 RepID=A0A0F4GA87_9PEZI|nr:telomere length regulation protein [Zymoseptoria brevis]